MVWSHHDSRPITLHPDIPQRLNLAWVETLVNRLTLDVEPMPMRAYAALSGTGTFKFEIQITARDCAAVDVAVKVAKGPDWDSVAAELIDAIAAEN